MCESSVYLLNGSDKKVVMTDVARIIANSDGVTCIDLLGERMEVPQVRIADANLTKHEIILKPKSG